MKLFRLLIFIGIVLSFHISAYAQSTTDSLLNKLNTVLANKDEYVKKKQDAIAAVKKQLSNAQTEEQKYNVYDQLYEQYKSFIHDSAYVYCKKVNTCAY